MCALGELLFYIATQKHEEEAAAEADKGVFGAWTVAPGTIRMVQHMLRTGEDETVRHYAVKTIENIFCQCPSLPSWFVSSECLYAMLGIFNETKAPNLRVSCASAMALLLKRDPTLLGSFVEKVGFPTIVDALQVCTHTYTHACTRTYSNQPAGQERQDAAGLPQHPQPRCAAQRAPDRRPAVQEPQVRAGRPPPRRARRQ